MAVVRLIVTVGAVVAGAVTFRRLRRGGPATAGEGATGSPTTATIDRPLTEEVDVGGDDVPLLQGADGRATPTSTQTHGEYERGDSAREEMDPR